MSQDSLSKTKTPRLDCYLEGLRNPEPEEDPDGLRAFTRFLLQVKERQGMQAAVNEMFSHYWMLQNDRDLGLVSPEVVAHQKAFLDKVADLIGVPPAKPKAAPSPISPKEAVPEKSSPS